MKKLTLFAAVLFAAMLFSLSAFADDTHDESPIFIKDQSELWYLLTGRNGLDDRGDKPSATCPGGMYELESKFPEVPFPVVIEIVPRILQGTFYGVEAEEYEVTLIAFSVADAVRLDCKGLTAVADATIELHFIRTPHIKPLHFDMLLASVRTDKPIVVKGYVTDLSVKSNGVTIPLFTGLRISIALYPTSIGGKAVRAVKR